MKTTIQIPDSLMKEAHKFAHQEGTTLNSLVEEGLRRVIYEHRKRGKFKIRKATFRGKGHKPRLKSATWDQLRDLSYKGRGT